MAELERRSGVPRSTIHFYLRKGLLPPAKKTAHNAAVYDQRHLQLVKAVGKLREGPAGPLPLPLMRRVLQLVSEGVEPDVAVALERAVLGSAPAASEGTFTVSEAAREAGVEECWVRKLLDLKLLVPVPGSSRLDGMDVELIRVLRGMVGEAGLVLEDAADVSRRIRELSEREMEMRNKSAGEADPEETAQISLRLQEGVNVLHSYFFYRWRLHDIEKAKPRTDS